MNTIFPVRTLDRSVIQWETMLNDLTPVEERGGIHYKREDYFAPLSYGGINGSKLRQCIYLIGDAWNRGATRLVTGASVLSPQVSMAALVGRHYGLDVEVWLGATKPETCLRHENVRIAKRAGAEFRFTPVGFNPALQREVARRYAALNVEVIADGIARAGAAYWLRYGITTPDDASDEEVAAFHALGAQQTENIPASVNTLVMTAGSCNSCVSVLTGIALRRPESLSRVVLLGVGPTRLEWIERRLESVSRGLGVDDLGATYRRLYHHHPALEAEHQADGPILLEHYDLHSTGFATYQDRMPRVDDGIAFHPTYEGKALTYMHHHHRSFDWYHARNGTALFWIVGSEPSAAAMLDTFVLELS